ncbi:MAG: glycosyltransferase family 4 protein, partial [Blastocatellia bacterium]
PVMRLADKVVVPSGFLVDVFKRFGLQAAAVFNVVDMEMFAYRDRDVLRPVFLSNRNLEALYNVGCILTAFGKIQRRYPDARLIVAGDGKQREALKRKARDLGLRNTEFVGQVSPPRMSELYREADIYLNSSNIDNMPGSILESFSSGLPVVTTDAGGIPYIVKNEETGLMVRCGDADGLAASAIRLLEDVGLARRLTRKARSECVRYSWSAVRDEWVGLYARLAARPEWNNFAPSAGHSRDSALLRAKRKSPVNLSGCIAAEHTYSSTNSGDSSQSGDETLAGDPA